MSFNNGELRPARAQSNDPRRMSLVRSAEHRARENFSTALFTSLNIAVFLVLAASVVGAAILYSQGA